MRSILPTAAGLSFTLVLVARSGAVAPLQAGSSALDDPGSSEFPQPLVPIDEIISGGSPPGGIPPIDEPVFISVSEAQDPLEPAKSVVALEVNGEAKAFAVCLQDRNPNESNTSIRSGLPGRPISRERAPSRAEFHHRVFAGQEHLTRAVPSECVVENVSGGADVGMD